MCVCVCSKTNLCVCIFVRERERESCVLVFNYSIVLIGHPELCRKNIYRKHCNTVYATVGSKRKEPDLLHAQSHLINFNELCEYWYL